MKTKTEFAGKPVKQAKQSQVSQPRRPKHVPMRTCIGTQQKHPKRDMVRIVRMADGHLAVDPTGKLGGSRGTYISKSYAAAEAAVRKKRLEAEFEQPIAKEDIEAILAFFSQFDVGAVSKMPDVKQSDTGTKPHQTG